MGSVPRTNGLTEGKLSSSGHQSVQQLDNNSKINVARISLSHGSEPGMKEMKNTPVTTVDSVPSTPQRAGMSFASKNLPASSAPPSYVLTPKKNIVSRVQPTTSFQALGRSDVVPVIVPRNSVRLETTADSKKEMNNIGRTLPCTVSSKSSDVMKPMTSRDEFDRIDMACQSGSLHLKRAMCNDRTDQNFVSRLDTSSINSTAVAEGNQAGVRCIGASKFRRNTSLESVGSPHDRNATFPWPIPDDGGVFQPDRRVTSTELAKRVESGRARALVANWERRERGLDMNTTDPPVLVNSCSMNATGVDTNSFIPRGGRGASERDCAAADDNDAIEDLMEQHNSLTSNLQTRLTKLQVIRQFWERNDPKGAIEAMGKMGDHAVLVDVISVLIDRSEVFTLEICTVILPLLTLLLGSEIDRHLNVALETLLVLVKSFGHVIRTTMAASPAFGVDLQAEQRLERCNLCYIELEKVKQILVPLVRRGGAVAKSAQELGVALQEV
eukprot:Gb_06352 [translate_table: standard]